MERHFEAYLKDLMQHLITMGNLAEQSLSFAIQGLETSDVKIFEKVYEIEGLINQHHKTLDEECVRLLALHQPLAKDLRWIVAIIKINSDLERIGDQAINICNNAEHYLKATPIKPLVDLPIMFHYTKQMLKDSLEAFVTQKTDLADKVLADDHAVDRLKHKIMSDVLSLIERDPKIANQGLSLIFIARNLERIGDHATNIAEDVIFATLGKDVRHQHEPA